jgi:hypothetical protein
MGEESKPIPVSHRDYQYLYRLVLAIALAIAGFFLQTTLSRIDKHLDDIDHVQQQHGEDLAATRAILEGQYGPYRKAKPK